MSSIIPTGAGELQTVLRKQSSSLFFRGKSKDTNRNRHKLTAVVTDFTSARSGNLALMSPNLAMCPNDLDETCAKPWEKLRLLTFGEQRKCRSKI
jgi:hypothetical protein